MYKQTNTICKPKRIRLFTLVINCTILMKTNSRFSRNVYTISDRIWCNKHLRHTTTEKYENNVKGGYFWFGDDNNMSYRYILRYILYATYVDRDNFIWAYYRLAYHTSWWLCPINKGIFSPVLWVLGAPNVFTEVRRHYSRQWTWSSII